MKIILFGAPGSGKGTQAVLLSEQFGLKKISLGDILREEVKKKSVLGKKVKDYMEKGSLVPDEVVALVIENNLPGENFILDGYPRNLNQAKTLEEIFKKKGLEYDAFIYLEVPEDLIVNRLTKRRICQQCGANYHLENIPPKVAGVCDQCSGVLIQRPDDNCAVIKKRWEVFSDESKKIIDFYLKKEKLLSIDGTGTKDEIFARIKNKLG